MIVATSAQFIYHMTITLLLSNHNLYQYGLECDVDDSLVFRNRGLLSIDRFLEKTRFFCFAYLYSHSVTAWHVFRVGPSKPFFIPLMFVRSDLCI
jgi:hypothetical protein